MNDLKVLSLKNIEDAPNVEFDLVEAWGGLVRIGSLTADQMIEHVEGLENPATKRMAGLRLIVLSLVDIDGKRLFTDETIGKGVAIFGKKDSKTTSLIVRRLLKLNGMTRAAAEAAKKDLGEDVTDAPRSDSPSR